MTFKKANLLVKLDEAVFLKEKYAAKGEIYWVKQMENEIARIQMELSK